MSAPGGREDRRLVAADDVFIIESRHDLELDDEDDPDATVETDPGAPQRAAAPQQRAGLAARAQSAAARPKTAREALEHARREEQRQADERLHEKRLEEERLDEARRLAAKVARDAQARQRRKATPSAPERLPRPADPMATLAAESAVVDLIAAIAEDADVLDTWVAIPREVCLPIWRSHHVRARVEGRLDFAAAAHGVVTALVHRPEHVVACKVALGGAEWALWLDMDRRTVLAAAEPALVYLVGL